MWNLLLIRSHEDVTRELWEIRSLVWIWFTTRVLSPRHNSAFGGKSITLALSEITPMSWLWRGLTWCDSRRSDEDCLALTRYHWFYTTSGSSGRGTDGTEPTSGWRTSWRTFRPRPWAQGCSALKPAAEKSLTWQQIIVTEASYFALLDQLTLGGQIYRTVDHLPDPHHGVGVRGGRQHGLQGEGEL